MGMSSFLSGIKEKASGIHSALKGVFKGLPSIKFPHKKSQNSDPSGPEQKEKSFFGGATARFGWFRDFVADRMQNIPESKRRPLIICIGSLVVIFMVLIAALVMRTGKTEKETSPSMMAGFTIPQEELFLPVEPDFVPRFIFEREPRRYWSLEDIRPYWRAPEISERWREEIRSAVDRLMEGVP